METWLEFTPAKSMLSEDNVLLCSLPRALVSTNILIVTDTTQDASRVHVIDLCVSWDGDTGLEFG
jgi:hypothetical protein